MFMFGFIISCCWRCIRCLVNRILISSFISSLCLIRIFVVCFTVYAIVYVIAYAIVYFIACAIVSVGLWLYTLLLTSLSNAGSLTHSYSPYSYYWYYFYLNSSHFSNFSNFYCHYSNSLFSPYDTLSYS